MDGKSGPKTKAAAKTFQEDNPPLVVDSDIGLQTMLKVEEVLNTVDVPGIVPLLAQPTSMTCWATVTTMMLSWRDGRSYTIEEAMDTIGPTYRTKFDNNSGLTGSEKTPFLATAGLRGEPPMNFSVDALRGLLQEYVW